MNKKNTWLTCSIIALVLLCLGGIFLVGGFGVLVALFGDEPPVETAVAPAAQPVQTTNEEDNRPADLYESVVQIIALVEMDGETVEGWSGSGSIISSDGLILTNAHVVLSDKFYDVQDLVIAFTTDPNYPAEPRFYADVMQVNEGLDLAVIRVRADLNGNPVDYAALNLPAVPLGDSDALQLGGKLTIMGYPGIGGVTITLTSGEVGGFTSETGVGQRAFIKTSATISGGNSGGLAVNYNGELIGVPTQLGYGGDDQFVDCRVLADTNRDGVVDDDDSCVPTGGFINALRPVKLAMPLIEAAKRGEVNFVAGQKPASEAPPVYAAGSLIFEDNFSSSASGWSTQDTVTGSSDYRDGQYVIEVNEPNYDVWSNYDREEFTDTIIGVDVNIIQSANGAGGVGIMCRYVDNNNYYKLEVDEDGYYTIYKYLDGEFMVLYDWERLSSLENKSSWRLTAACIGNELTLLVDDVVVASVTDDSFTQGYIGLVGGVFDDPGIIVGFDNLTVHAP